MRYRALDSNGDYSFGQNLANFLIDDAAAVGQAVKTRLLLFQGEWFLDITAGTPWGGFPLNAAVVAEGVILGDKRSVAQDLAIQATILGTQGVQQILTYSSSYNSQGRLWSLNVTIETIYAVLQFVGTTLTSGIFEIGISPLGGGAGLG
jgi:hypothetical protein